MMYKERQSRLPLQQTERAATSTRRGRGDGDVECCLARAAWMLRRAQSAGVAIVTDVPCVKFSQNVQ
ncbi:hypothetical protein Y032_0037g3435 [Ancylostoma ceylanicum]|uniref:Uncharacterized protein n=1 Tax=Ancylostoma ceylanicum TaxID=53326 RepID=A0A016UIS6_9BILA|nr:hypothetical protein Y032_0037g3435 [Ancylostoma ceylanicum]